MTSLRRRPAPIGFVRFSVAEPEVDPDLGLGIVGDPDDT
jgi:hypothetical protein